MFPLDPFPPIVYFDLSSHVQTVLYQLEVFVTSCSSQTARYQSLPKQEGALKCQNLTRAHHSNPDSQNKHIFRDTPWCLFPWSQPGHRPTRTVHLCLWAPGVSLSTIQPSISLILAVSHSRLLL